MGCFVRFPYDEQSHLEVMDTMFFVGVNAGLLILLIFGLVSAKAKIKAGRKQIIRATNEAGFIAGRGKKKLRRVTAPRISSSRRSKPCR